MAKIDKIDGIGDNMAGLISTLIGQFMPLSASEREQNAFNQRMAEDAFNRQIQYYENYQSPQAMVKQYQEAGINPALVAGYSPSNPPSSSAASGSGGSPALGLIQLAMEMRMKNKELDIQRDLATAEIQNKQAETENIQENTQNKKYENMSAEEFYKLRNQSASADISKTIAATSNIEEQTALTIVQRSIKELDFEFYNKVQDARSKAFLAAARATEDSSDMTHYEAENYAYRYALEMKNIIANTYLSNMHAEQVREYTNTMLKSPYVDAAGKEHLNRVAAMTDAEINQMMKDNKGRVWRNWIGTVSGVAAATAVAAGALSKFFPAGRAAAVIAAPIERLSNGYGSFSEQYGTFDTNM